MPDIKRDGHGLGAHGPHFLLRFVQTFLVPADQCNRLTHSREPARHSSADPADAQPRPSQRSIHVSLPELLSRFDRCKRSWRELYESQTGVRIQLLLQIGRRFRQNDL
jgi:hypothetical protein